MRHSPAPREMPLEEGYMVGGQVCGVDGKVCPEDQYPICDPVAPGDVWVEKRAIVMVPNKLTGATEYRFLTENETDKPPEGARSPLPDNPKTTDFDENEIKRLLVAGPDKKIPLTQYGYAGICRSVFSPFRWFAYKASGMASFLAYYKTGPAGTIRDPKGFKMNPAEMMALAQAFGWNEDDVVIKNGYAPQKQPDGSYTPGTYLFPNNYNWLTTNIPLIEDESQMPISSSSEEMNKNLKETRKKLAAYLKDLLAKTPQDGQNDRDLWGRIFQVMGFTVSVLSSAVLSVLFYKQYKLSRKMMDGDSDKNKLENYTSDLVADQRSKLALNRQKYEILGRDEEALEFLRRLARPRYANPLLLGESGVGKDKIVERAAQLIALKDKRVPRKFYDGTIKTILIVDPNKFGANINIRGDAAARNAELVRAMKEGKAVYFPELSDFLTSGTSSGGNSESLGSALKDALTRNSRFAGSTTPKSFQALVKTIPWLVDLARRLPPQVVHDLHVDVLRSIIKNSTVPFYEADYNVTITPEAGEAAVNLALLNMPPESHARYDAIDQLIVLTIEQASVARRTDASQPLEINVQDVASTVSKMTGRQVDPTAKFVEPSLAPSGGTGVLPPPMPPPWRGPGGRITSIAGPLIVGGGLALNSGDARAAEIPTDPITMMLVGGENTLILNHPGNTDTNVTDVVVDTVVPVARSAVDYVSPTLARLIEQELIKSARSSSYTYSSNNGVSAVDSDGSGMAPTRTDAYSKAMQYLKENYRNNIGEKSMEVMAGVFADAVVNVPGFAGTYFRDGIFNRNSADITWQFSRPSGGNAVIRPMTTIRAEDTARGFERIENEEMRRSRREIIDVVRR